MSIVPFVFWGASILSGVVIYVSVATVIEKSGLRDLEQQVIFSLATLKKMISKRRGIRNEYLFNHIYCLLWYYHLQHLLQVPRKLSPWKIRSRRQ